MRDSIHHAANRPVDALLFRSCSTQVFHASALLAAALLLAAVVSSSAFAGNAAGTAFLSVNVTEGVTGNWNLPLGTSFLTVDPATGAITMPPVGTTFGANWGWDKVDVLDQDTKQWVQKDAVTWHNSASTASLSIYATGNVDPFMTYAVSARNTSGVTQSYTLHYGETVVPPVVPGTYGVYSDIAGSISNGAGSITIAPTIGSKIQYLNLSTDGGGSYGNAGVDLGDPLATSALGTTPYPFASLSGGGSTLDSINYWAFDVSFTLTPNDAAALSGYAEITQLTVIPEPSAYAALLGGVTLIGTVLVRRRTAADRIEGSTQSRV